MRGQRLFSGVVVLLAMLVVAVAPAVAKHSTKHHHRHHRLHCKHGYVARRVKIHRRIHGRRVTVHVRRCVRKRSKIQPPKKTLPGQPPTAPVAPTISYQAAVDPSFTQAPGNPLAVTYAYSADATATIGQTVTHLAQVAQLPGGILNFYSSTTPGGPEQLECSMNVGGGVSAGSCPIGYAATGTYTVTTQYIPTGTTAVTETESETITPFATASTLIAVAGACGAGSPPGFNSLQGPYCTWTVANTLTDQDGLPLNGTTALVAAAAAFGQDQGASVPTNGSCIIYATASDLVSSDCNLSLGTGSTTKTEWSVTTEFQGSDAFSPSASAPVTLTP